MPPGSRWRNRFISSKFYDKEVGVSISGQQNKKTNRSDDTTETEFKIKRRRVVDLHYLANVMFCASCKSALSLDNIDNEYLKQLESMASRRCQKCVPFKTVLTWKTHNNRFNEPLNDLSIKATPSEPNDALNHSSVEKFLRTMKVPYMTSRTYVKYEKDVGPVIETEGTESGKENG